jgi:hypothetical protein
MQATRESAFNQKISQMAIVILRHKFLRRLHLGGEPGAAKRSIERLA